ncbi:hypothetical protein PX554_12925 [Sphingomonas sp. H39-1-10]|uniref:hypothetical protein n=1 Tax=Sphingomonas TaxID=13687 RepID=UPI00088D0ACB|nr:MULTISPECIES: hypothetical protein [Sphingomonas]MDF0489039.1 hypothetical protein [Sphingomonas pollutisoli]SDA20544.1 hypothetical protein SAMN03159340_01274 [Sphingomonas sp. NFR15]
MNKTLLLAASLFAAVSTPALADTAPQHTFTRDGDTYVYTTKQVAGRTIISGRVLNTGDTFELAVRGNRVTGFTGRREVAFNVPAASARAVASTAN